MTADERLSLKDHVLPALKSIEDKIDKLDVRVQSLEQSRAGEEAVQSYRANRRSFDWMRAATLGGWALTLAWMVLSRVH